MKFVSKGLILAVLQVAIVTSLGGKLLYDRATRPRVWVRTAPFDPDLPIRGRYVRLQLEVTAPQVVTPAPNQMPVPVVLRVDHDRLIAEPSKKDFDPSEPHVRAGRIRRDTDSAILFPPIAFFISEHVKDPSIREAGEELWAEVTIPKNGPPRPIRLGVKKGDAAIKPLELN